MVDRSIRTFQVLHQMTNLFNINTLSTRIRKSIEVEEGGDIAIKSSITKRAKVRSRREYESERR